MNFDRSSFTAIGGVFMSPDSEAVTAMWASYSFATAKGNSEVRAGHCVLFGAGYTDAFAARSAALLYVYSVCMINSVGLYLLRIHDSYH